MSLGKYKEVTNVVGERSHPTDCHFEFCGAAGCSNILYIYVLRAQVQNCIAC